MYLWLQCLTIIQNDSKSWIFIKKCLPLHHYLRLVVITSLTSYVLGYPMPTYFQLVLGGVSFFNTLGKEAGDMKNEMLKAVGAVAAGR